MPKDHVVLITGAAGGIGRATVSLLAKKGWHVIGVDRMDFGDHFPANGLFIKSDISRPEDMQAIFEKAHTFTDKLDALVNNAAGKTDYRDDRRRLGCSDGIQFAICVFGSQTSLSTSQSRRWCGRKCFVGARYTNLGQYCGIRRVEGRIACSHPRHGD